MFPPLLTHDLEHAGIVWEARTDAAIDRDHLSIEVTGGIGCQECRKVPDVLRLAEARSRGVFEELAAHGLRHFLYRMRRKNEPWRDAIAADILAAILNRDIAGIAFDRAFCRAISSLCGLREGRGAGNGVDDGSAAAGNHQRNGVPASPIGAVHVPGEHLI